MDTAAVDVLVRIAQNNRNPGLQRRAVSALISTTEGVPALIQLVKTAPDAALRKQAMSSLQQSRDPRALGFFEDLLKR